MHFYVKHVKCAGCGVIKTYAGKGLQIKHRPGTNYKLLLACSEPCAQKFINDKPDDSEIEFDATAEPETLMTKNGPIPYRKIVQTKPELDSEINCRRVPECNCGWCRDPYGGFKP